MTDILNGNQEEIREGEGAEDMNPAEEINVEAVKAQADALEAELKRLKKLKKEMAEYVTDTAAAAVQAPAAQRFETSAELEKKWDDIYRAVFSGFRSYIMQQRRNPETYRNPPALCQVVLQESDGSTHQSVGINGNVVKIPKGKEVVMPIEFANVLKQAMNVKPDPVYMNVMLDKDKKAGRKPFKKMEGMIMPYNPGV